MQYIQFVVAFLLNIFNESCGPRLGRRNEKMLSFLLRRKRPYQYTQFTFPID